MTLKNQIKPFTVTDAMSIIWKEEIDTPQLVRSDINKKNFLSSFTTDKNRNYSSPNY